MITPTRPAPKIGARILCRDLEDACRLMRWLEHRAPGLRTELEDAEARFPAVRVGVCSSEANGLWDQYQRGGRDAQIGRDVAAGEGGWEE